MALTRTDFDKLTHLTELYTCRPWDGTEDHLDETFHVQSLDVEVTTAHEAWLDRARRRALRAGRNWDHTEVARQARIREAGE